MHAVRDGVPYCNTIHFGISACLVFSTYAEQQILNLSEQGYDALHC